jgi:hypothetical protein
MDAVTPPTWLDTRGRRRPTLACWTCGREVVLPPGAHALPSSSWKEKEN